MSPAQEKILSDGTDVAGIPSSWRATCATRGKRPSFFFHHASGVASSSEGSCRYRRSSSLAVLVVFGTMKLRRAHQVIEGEFDTNTSLPVLPPLKDEVKHLPEEGNTLRNRLCKLLTSPILEVKELAADFLFVLCKESDTETVLVLRE
ncbi:RIC8A-like protein [Mya arenaria]|uniref:RIC8A-like protein n=1 Tax=Mya arenaria TaxID=6604 RepID=A0ABY7EZW6_MYAAR|nr:RIC8A-like protein [Mya arenaria]